MRPSALISRLGGDEFVVVSSGLHRAEEAMEIAARLQSAVGQPWRIGNELIHPSLSIGIALAGGSEAAGALDGAMGVQMGSQMGGELEGDPGCETGCGTGSGGVLLDSAELRRRADLAMYDAKAVRSPRAHCYEPAIDQQQRQTLLLLQTLREALASERLELHFQPIYQLGSGVLRGGMRPWYGCGAAMVS